MRLKRLQTANQQHYIPIVDAAIAKVVNASDVVRTTSTDIVDVQLSGSTQYDPYARGNELYVCQVRVLVVT